MNRPRPQKFEKFDDLPEQYIPLSLRRKTICINGKRFSVKSRDLEKIQDLGRGTFGIVEKMVHKATGQVMAVKRIACQSNTDQKVLTTDLDVSIRSTDCPFTVHFFGALFDEGDLWIFMEVMDTSLDKFYPLVFKHGRQFPEDVLGKISIAIVNALHFLHANLKVIHRDVKPSNVLINRFGEVKMCDFGIAGYLVNSMARTVDVGCKLYMAPERIDPSGNPASYDIRSDVWSFGISLIEIATGNFPYGTWSTPFEQIQQVVFEAAPRLPAGQFTVEFDNFVDACLQKKCINRPNYNQLLQHVFIVTHEASSTNVGEFVEEILSLH